MNYISSLPTELLNLISIHLDKESFVNCHSASHGMHTSLSPKSYLEHHPRIISDLVNQSGANFKKIPPLWKKAVKEAATTELKLRHYKVVSNIPHLFKIFTDITKLDTLEILTLGNYTSEISSLKNLKNLKVQGVTKEFFTSIREQLVELEIKDVHAIGCKDDSWHKLESLIISNEHQDFEEIQDITKLTSLKKLRISSKNILNIEHLHLEQMPNLEYIQLETILCEEHSLQKILQWLSQVPSLKKIDLKLKIDKPIDKKSINLIKELANCRQLGNIRLSINPKGKGVNCLGQLFHHLSKHIDMIQIETNSHLNYNKSFFDSILTDLCEVSLPSLTTLFLETHLLTIQQLIGICKAHPGIKSLSLEKCTLNPLDLSQIYSLTKLEKLNLALTKSNDDILKGVRQSFACSKITFTS